MPVARLRRARAGQGRHVQDALVHPTGQAAQPGVATQPGNVVGLNVRRSPAQVQAKIQGWIQQRMAGLA
jgi:hypothetical protein